MNPFASLNGTAKPVIWTIGGLDPTPEDEWARMRAFLGITDAEIEAMLATVEPLFKRGHELVVGTYDYLLQNPETAAILGWEGGADQAHLSERRRFFTVWLARLLGMDFSTDLARYLFRAGKLHAAHGPRRAHVPPDLRHGLDQPGQRDLCPLPGRGNARPSCRPDGTGEAGTRCLRCTST